METLSYWSNQLYYEYSKNWKNKKYIEGIFYFKIYSDISSDNRIKDENRQSSSDQYHSGACYSLSRFGEHN